MTRAAPKSGPAQSWKTQLLRKRDDSGKPKIGLRPVAANVTTILTHDPAWAGVIAYDEFGETIVTRAPPPWRPVDAPVTVTMGDWTDLDTVRTQSWLADRYAIDAGQDTVLAGVSVVADRHRFHPVRDWLSSLRWDGQKRLPTWLHDVFGCPDTPYARAVGQAWAISAIARAFTPGCKVDTVLVLEGDPGIRKSSVLRALFGDEWFLEMSITDVANKDAMQLLKRKWGAEFPEIDGLSRTEQAHVKAYFSRQVDTYRPSYGKGTRDFPRQIVFAASTNKNEYLTDETGGTGRRMWPARCRTGNIALVVAIREQFWAEAVARFESGEAWHIQDPSLRDAEREEQDARFRTDPWEQSVAEWLAKPVDLGGSRARAGVTTADVLVALGIETGRRSHADAIRIGAIMRRLDWIPGNPELRNGARVRVYRPKGDPAINDSEHLNVDTLDPPGTPIQDVDPAELAFTFAE